MGAGERNKEISDHALVFMVRGLKKPFKQPLCYVFSAKGGDTATKIKKISKEILHRLLDIDLKPITTGCDQATTNVKVLKGLILTWNKSEIYKE